MSEKDRNGILLLFLSDFKDKSESGSDYTINGRSYFGRQTNEAPTKFLLDTAHTDGYPIKKVLCITSKLVIEKKNNDGKTSYEVFSERLREYRSSKKYDGEVDIIPIDYEKSEEEKENDGFSDIALPVYTELNENLRSNDDIRVYIDYTGGFRDISFLMTTVVRFLEIKGIKTGRIVYSSYTEHRIIDITYIYNIMRLINGVDEFSSTGNPGILNGFVKDEELKGAYDLLKAITELADQISLCQIDGIDNSFANVKTALETFALDEAKGETALYLAMLKEMIPIIKKNMYLDEAVSIPNIIRWCLDNSLIQQAITLYVEKMPSYYFSQGIIKRPEDDTEDDTGLFYGKVYDDLLRDPRRESFFEMIKEINDPLVDEPKPDWNSINNKYRDLSEQIERVKEIYTHRYVNKEEKYTIGDEIIEQKNFKRFLNAVSNNKYVYYLYDGDKVQPTVEHDGYRAYIKKWNAAKVLTNPKIASEIGYSDSSKIVKILRYYLAIKMMRNSLNHANDLSQAGQKDSSYEEVKEKLKQEADIDIEVGMDMEKIKGILLRGIELLKSE